MDVLPSIWLSSITSALCFFSGGRFWAKVQDERDAVRAHQEAEAEIQTLSETVRQQKVEAIVQRAHVEELEGALAAERASADELEERLAQALERAVASTEAEAASKQEAAVLSTEQRTARTDLAAAEARLETMRVEMSALRQRADEVVRLRAENSALRMRLEERAKAAARAASPAPAPVAPPASARPREGQNLEEVLAEQLEALRLLDAGCRTVVLSDMRGLVVASSGDTARDRDLAAVASLASDTPGRLRQILPFGEPVEIRFVDAHDAVFTARWLRGGHEGLLLSTLGAATAKPDPRAGAVRDALQNLLGWT